MEKKTVKVPGLAMTDFVLNPFQKKIMYALMKCYINILS